MMTVKVFMKSKLTLFSLLAHITSLVEQFICASKKEKLVCRGNQLIYMLEIHNTLIL